MDPIIIVGTGLAGYTLAREFRKLDKTTPLTLISRDDGAFYSKPMLSNAFASQKTPDQLATQSAAHMALQLDATVRPHATVTAIDPSQRRLILNNETHTYSKLVLAMGANPLRAPLSGDGATDVLSVNDLTDYRQFRSRLAPGMRIAIIGAGLIGCEFANDLRVAGFDVTLINRGNYPLDHLIPEAAGLALRDALAAIGVRWELNATVESVGKNGTGYVITTAQGHTIDADIVLSAVGLRPRIELAQASGLNTQRGIAVDRFLRSSDSHIFALGDCAQVDGYVLSFVLPLMNAARALAKTLAGEATQVIYPAMPVVVKTPAHPLVVASPPREFAGTWQCENLPGGVRCLAKSSNDQLLGFVLTGTITSERQALSKSLPALFG